MKRLQQSLPLFLCLLLPDSYQFSGQEEKAEATNQPEATQSTSISIDPYQTADTTHITISGFPVGKPINYKPYFLSLKPFEL